MKQPHFPNQQELDDSIPDLRMTKSNAELLMSILMDWNFFGQHFVVKDDLCFCDDIGQLDSRIGHNGWRLFINIYQYQLCI